MFDHRILASLLTALVVVVSGCAINSGTTPIHPGQAAADGGPEHEGPAYFTQATAIGSRYAHNWVGRPCFTVELPGGEWILQSSTQDFVTWRRGRELLKVYVTDNRDVGYAVRGMGVEGILRAFVGYELEYIRPKFGASRSTAPQLDRNDHGQWAHWGWQGRTGVRAGVGNPTPADQNHLVSSLWIDPWVLSFDWATSEVLVPYERDAEMATVLRSLEFHPGCFEKMRTGETWTAAGS